MQIISASLLGSEKILPFKSYLLHVLHRHTPLLGGFLSLLITQLNFLFSNPSEEDLRGTVMMMCKNETGLISLHSRAATEFWKSLENRSLNCL